MAANIDDLLDAFDPSRGQRIEPTGEEYLLIDPEWGIFGMDWEWTHE